MLRGLWHPKEHKLPEARKKEETDRPVIVAGIFACWFLFSGLLGFFTPELALLARGIRLDDSVSPEQVTVVRGAQVSQVLHLFLMAGLHLVMCSDGAQETSFKSTHTENAVRTLLLSDSIWVALTCIWYWVALVPAMRDNSWNAAGLLLESACLVGLGLLAFSQSRGKESSVLGGLVKTQLNSATLKMPSFTEKNHVFLFGMILCGLGAIVTLLVPGLMLKAFAGDVLTGPAAAAAGIVVQLHGVCYMNEFLMLLAVVSTQVLALEYSACRLIWLWGFGKAVFFGVGREAARLLNLPETVFLAALVLHAVLSGFAYRGLAVFAKKSLTEKVTGRTL